jgi:hypothetical protein
VRKEILASACTLSALLVSCGTPAVTDGEITLSGASVLMNADVTVVDTRSGGSYTGKTALDGTFEIARVPAIGDAVVKVCKGQFYSASVSAAISTDMCLWRKVKLDGYASSGKGLVIDFVSSFIATYSEATSSQEWKSYLGVASLPRPVEESSLTDSTKMWLWSQGLSQVAAKVSMAAGVSPESTLSTKKLFDLLIADLKDNNKIDGSTKAVFGGLDINGAVLKGVIAEAIPNTVCKFTRADLQPWLTSISNSNARFLSSDQPPDPEGPQITIEKPAENVVAGTFEIRATATDNVKVTSLACTFAGTAVENTSVENATFEAVFDTTRMEDGPAELMCAASDGVNLSSKTKNVTIKNRNEVTVGVYIAEPVRELDGVFVFDVEGKPVTTLQPDAGGVITGLLAPGTYIFKTSGGKYESKVLNTDPQTPLILKLNRDLYGRLEVKAGAKNRAIITPLTDFREYLYKALAAKGDPDAVQKSLDLFNSHFKIGFDIYVEPGPGSAGDMTFQSYEVLAALERLAYKIAVTQKLSIGTVTIEDIIATMEADLADALLDGTGKTQKIQGWQVDCYFFRYWYAEALKELVEGQGYSFNDFQAIISSISMDTSELFPTPVMSQCQPREVVNTPPQINPITYKTAYTGDFVWYDKGLGSVPYSTDTFGLRFKVVPGKHQIMLDSLTSVYGPELTCTVPTASIGYNNSVTYDTTCTFDGTKEDGEKALTIDVYDDAGNHGQASLVAIKDMAVPELTLSGLPTHPVQTGSTLAEFTTAFDNTRQDFGVAAYTAGPLPITVLTPGTTPLKDLLINEGVQDVNVWVINKAATQTKKTGSITIDNSPPSIENGAVLLLEPLLTPTRSITLQLKIEKAKLHDKYSTQDNIKLSFIIVQDGSAEVAHGPITTLDSGFYQYYNDQIVPNHNYRFDLYLTDEAGNFASVYYFSWTVDQKPPIVSDLWFRTEHTGQFLQYDDIQSPPRIPYVAEGKTVTLRVKAEGQNGRTPAAGTIGITGAAASAMTCNNPQELGGSLYSVDCTFKEGTADGPYLFKMAIEDTLGNPGSLPAETDKYFTIVNDDQNPAVTMDRCPDSPSRKKGEGLEFKATSTEPNFDTASYRLNQGGAVVPYTLGETVSITDNAALLEGSNAVVVKVTDKAGNSGAGTCTFTIDDTAPTADDGSISQINPSPSYNANRTTTDTTFKLTVSRQHVDGDGGIITPGLRDNVSPWNKITGRFKWFIDGVQSGTEKDLPADTQHSYKVTEANLDSPIVAGHKYGYEIWIYDEAGNPAKVKESYWYVDATPPPIIVDDPGTTITDTVNINVRIGSGDPSNPDRTLFPASGEILNTVAWQDTKTGGIGICGTCTNNQCICTITSIEQGPHIIRFIANDLAGNHVADADLEAHCLASDNAHCRTMTITWDSAGPNVQLALTPDPAVTKQDLKINWSEQTDGSYTCSIYAPADPAKSLYNCSADNGDTLNMATILSSEPDGTYVVQVNAVRYGKESHPTATFDLDRTAPEIISAKVTGQDATSFTVEYNVTDAFPATATINVHSRKYYDNSGDYQEDDPSFIIMNAQPHTSGVNTFMASKAALSGGSYRKFYVCATDKLEHTACKDMALVNCSGGICNGNDVNKKTRNSAIIQRNICTHTKTIKGKEYCYLDAVIRICDSCIPVNFSFDSMELKAKPVSTGDETDFDGYILNICGVGCKIYTSGINPFQNIRFDTYDGMTITKYGDSSQTTAVRDTSNSLWEGGVDNNFQGKGGLFLAYIGLNAALTEDTATNSGCINNFFEGFGYRMFHPYYDQIECWSDNPTMEPKYISVPWKPYAITDHPLISFAVVDPLVFTVVAHVNIKGDSISFQLLP